MHVPGAGARGRRSDKAIVSWVILSEYQMHHGGRLAMESIRLASSSLMNCSACGSYLSGRFNCLTTPPSNNALAARGATFASQVGCLRVRMHSRTLPAWLALR